MNNIITLTDSYKCGHYNQYPEGTEGVYSYFESRNGAKFDTTVFFGLQYYLKKYLAGVVITEEKIVKAKALVDAHLGEGNFNEKMWRHILENHGGKLPVRIRAVPEGTPVPVSNVLMTVENTDPLCAPLTNHLETILTHSWSASTVATLSRETKKMLKVYLEATSDTLDGLNFMLHDFGARGVSSVESGAFCGAGHLVNFMGTDTISAIELAMDYYSADVCAYSVPATEHSVMTALGPEGEVKVLERLLDKYPTGILSVVSDSYDIYGFVKNYVCGKFKTRILERDGVFVVRPDSGDPVSTVIALLNILEEGFGTTVNSKGCKVLNPKVRVIWGDGIDYDGIGKILHSMKENLWSAENIVFGMGGGLLQKINRDNQRFAFKCSAQKRDGKWYDIYKDPIDKSKMSKKGKLALTRELNGIILTYKTIEQYDENDDENNILEIVFEDGELVREYTFNEIRKNAEL